MNLMGRKDNASCAWFIVNKVEGKVSKSAEHYHLFFPQEGAISGLMSRALCFSPSKYGVLWCGWQDVSYSVQFFVTMADWNDTEDDKNAGEAHCAMALERRCPSTSNAWPLEVDRLTRSIFWRRKFPSNDMCIDEMERFAKMLFVVLLN